jgi:hypothetical protein
MQIAPGFFSPLAFTYRLDYSDVTTYDKEPKMTMTRDRMADLLRQASATPDGYRMLVDAADLIALAERALQPQTPMDVTVYTLERLRGAMTRFGISCGEGGMEHFSVKFESHLLEFIRAATDSLDKLRQAYADLEASQRALQPEEGQSCEMTPEQMTAYAQSVADRAAELAQPLPELPDAPMLGGDPDYGDAVYGFTANQMGAYGRKCYDAGMLLGVI